MPGMRQFECHNLCFDAGAPAAESLLHRIRGFCSINRLETGLEPGSELGFFDVRTPESASKQDQLWAVSTQFAGRIRNSVLLRLDSAG
jgi:hypothetical protein